MTKELSMEKAGIFGHSIIVSKLRAMIEYVREENVRNMKTVEEITAGSFVDLNGVLHIKENGTIAKESGECPEQSIWESAVKLNYSTFSPMLFL